MTTTLKTHLQREAALPEVAGLYYLPSWEPQGVNDAGIPYSSFDVFRKSRLVFDPQIAGVTVYADGTALVLAHGADSVPNYKARAKLGPALVSAFPENIILTGIFRDIAIMER